MKKAKILMAIACLLFFSALAYTNWMEQRSKVKVKRYKNNMEEITIEEPRALEEAGSR